jgi:hypothetical protein
VVSYEEFVVLQFHLSPTDAEIQDLVESGNTSFAAEFEQYLGSSPTKALVTPIRYDYSTAHYRAGLHPASHSHFGFGIDMRVGTRNILKPISFTLFVVRQRYPQVWIELCSKGTNAFLFGQVRAELDGVDDSYRSSEDDREMALH